MRLLTGLTADLATPCRWPAPPRISDLDGLARPDS
jgi:hypothetical protein